MSTENKELVIKGITEQQLRDIIKDELSKFKSEIAEALIAAYEISEKSKEP